MNERTGNFTSSQIYRLMSKGRGKDTLGKPFFSYCYEKSFEDFLGRPVHKEASSPSLEWGRLCEAEAFQLLPLDCAFKAKKRYCHPALTWSGCPDYLKEDTVGDIKCPFTLKSAMDMCLINDIEEFKKKNPEYYWQLVSNAILCDKKFAELVVFVPSQDKYDRIMSMAQEANSPIKYKSIEELPFLPSNSMLSELTTISFEIPELDKEILTKHVEIAEVLKNDELKKIKSNYNPNKTL